MHRFSGNKLYGAVIVILALLSVLVTGIATVNQRADASGHQYGMPLTENSLRASDTFSITASVYVLGEVAERYGYNIVRNWNTNYEQNALGTPDGNVARMKFLSYMLIELEGPVAASQKVSLWAGTERGELDVWLCASPDGEEWVQLGSCAIHDNGTVRYDLPVNCGEIRYLLLSRIDLRIRDYLYIDAVSATGGE